MNASFSRCWLLTGIILAASFTSGAEPPAMDQFIVRQGDKLLEGDQEFRFLSWNIPNLHYVEDDMRFTQRIPFRWPDEYEIRDALESVRQMGGTVVRTYVLSVRKADDPPNMPCHVLAPGEFNEEGFKTLDTVLSIAREKGIRLVIPFVDNWHWWGGVPQYVAFRGKKENEFWTDPRLMQDFQQTVRFVVTRVNSRTGIAYKDDPTILAWETGNELASPHEWTSKIAAYIKQLDANHLVLDGKQRNVLDQQSIDNPYVNLLQTHHYEKSSREMVTHIRASAAMARGKKPYHVGEFGFLPTESMLEVIDTIISEGTAGGLIWSLRYHSRDGGFYWHHEPAGGDLFKAYHWPGFPSGKAYDETRFLSLVRQKAFAIRGLDEPPPSVPTAPVLIQVTPGGELTWRGSAGASGYDVQRRESAANSWTTIGENVSDAAVQYHSPFADTMALPGRVYNYRVIARNATGASAPSTAREPDTITHRTLVDELRNRNTIFKLEGQAEFRQNQARKFKEDAHRLAGQKRAAVTWKTPGQMTAAKLFVFAEKNGDILTAQASTDGESFESVGMRKEVYEMEAAGTYGYWTPILYRVSDMPESARYLRVEFSSDAQLSRVELSYGDD